MKPATRLYVTSDLAAGAALELSAAQAHYLRNVLRQEPGDAVALFNGRDGEWLGRIAVPGRRSVGVEAVAPLRPQEDEGDLWLVFAPIKRARLDFLVEKATELGVGALLPVVTRHTIVERMNLERLHANMIEAAEQSERLTVPVLHAPQPLDRLLSSWPAGRRLVLCDESGAAPAIAPALAELAPGALALLTGPEGGFAETELDGLRKLPFVCSVSLGPRVLRSDTAALAGLAVVQALAGDWRIPRRRPSPAVEASP